MVLSLASSFLAETPLQSKSGEEGGRKSTAFLLGPANGKMHREKGLPLRDADVSFFFLPHTYLSAESLKKTSFVYLPCIHFLAIEDILAIIAF